MFINLFVYGEAFTVENIIVHSRLFRLQGTSNQLIKIIEKKN